MTYVKQCFLGVDIRTRNAGYTCRKGKVEIVVHNRLRVHKEGLSTEICQGIATGIGRVEASQLDRYSKFRYRSRPEIRLLNR